MLSFFYGTTQIIGHNAAPRFLGSGFSFTPLVRVVPNPDARGTFFMSEPESVPLESIKKLSSLLSKALALPLGPERQRFAEEIKNLPPES